MSAVDGRRLVHGIVAHIKALEMSSCRVIAYCEGRTDRGFYDRVLDGVFGDRVKYQVRSVDELGGGGKEALTKFRKELSDADKLLMCFGGLTKAVVVFLDADFDTVNSACLLCRHTIYTKWHCLENYLFREGDVHACVAMAGDVSLASVRELVGDVAIWRAQAAMRWRDWVAQALFASRFKCGCASPRVSEINVHTFGEVDADKRDAYWAHLMAASGVDDGERSKVEIAVGEAYSGGRWDMLFSGKLYVMWLCNSLKALGMWRQEFSRRLTAHLVQSLPQNGEWVLYYRDALKAIEELVMTGDSRSAEFKPF